MIPYGRQNIDDSDIAAVVEVLHADFLTQGPAIPRFERALAEYCGVPHAVAVNSATSALHIACVSLGLGQGDVLWTSPNTFVASANCARHCGADVDFVDIDPRTYNMCAVALEAKLERARGEGRLPKIVVPVHFAGQSCDMRAIGALAKTYGFRVIEDASHAVGAGYDGGRVGDCRYADCTVFSFHPVKIVTTGEGGLLTTRDPALAQRLADLRSHGITRDPARLSASADGPWYYEQHALGWNFRMTDLQAALGYSQLRRLDRFLERRRELVASYRRKLQGLALVPPAAADDREPSWHLFVVQVERRAAVFEAMRASGIGVNVHYIPVYRQPYYRDLGFRDGHCPEAERYYSRALSLPLHAGLTDAEQDTVVEALARALRVKA